MKVRFFILLFLIPIFIKAQQTSASVDTLQQQIQAIPLAEIPSKAERLIQQINKEFQNEIYKSTIQEVQVLSDSLKVTAIELSKLSEMVLNNDLPYYILQSISNRWSRLIPLIEK